jgi:hypothetical protein
VRRIHGPSTGARFRLASRRDIDGKEAEVAKPLPGIPASADPSRASDGRWVAGRTGNPNGRPKGRENTNTIVEEMPVPLRSRKELAEFHGMPIEMLREGGNLWDWIYAVAAWQAVKGFADARNALLDRRERRAASLDRPAHDLAALRANVHQDHARTRVSPARDMDRRLVQASLLRDVSRATGPGA